MRTGLRILTLAVISGGFFFSPIGLLSQQPTQASPPSASPATPNAPPAELPDAPANQAPAALQPTGPTAVFDTGMGRITCKLFDKEAPETVANFIGLAEGSKDWADPATHKKMHHKPYYNGTTFHRVIPEFMIQGGDPLATGEGDPGYMFKDEFNPNLNFDVPGRLAMANAGPNTNGSQFFITEAPVEQLDQHYNLFGQCDGPGLEVVKAIARVDRDVQDKPLAPVMLNKVTIVREGQPIPAEPVANPPKTSAPQKPAAGP